MGSARQPEPQPSQDQQRAEAAAAIAALLVAGSTVATVPAVASALLSILPAFLLATPALAASVAEEAAKLALTDPPRFEPNAGEFERRASLENLLKRGLFAVASARRLTEALSGPSGATIQERLAKQLRAERSYLTASQNASRRRTKTARLHDAAVERWGPILSWSHSGDATEPRPHHVAADGRNFDTRRGPPRQTGGLPGSLPNCGCSPGAPKPGAEMLI